MPGQAQSRFVGWAVGGPDGSGPTILCTTNGQDWFRQGLGQIPYTFLEGVASKGSNVWVVGDVTNGYGNIYHSGDDGSTWTRQGDSNSIPAAELSKCWAVDEQNLWVVGYNGTVLHTTNGGAAWMNVSIAGYTQALQAVTAVGTQSAWVGGQPNQGDDFAGLFHTTNGGATWSQQAVGAITNVDHLLGMAAVDAQTVWGTGGAHQDIIVTTNAGATWEQKHRNADHRDGNEICVAPDGSVWTATDSTLFWSQNNGDSWDSSSVADFTMDIDSPDGTNVWAACGYYRGAIIYYSPDSRASWTEQVDGGFAGLANISMQRRTAATHCLFTNTIAQTTAAITNIMAEAQIPALSIALVDGTNIVWAQGFGMANREAGRPADADTLYRIASMTKSFAAMSVLKLQEGGALNIADNVTNTIPAFAMLPRFTNESISIRSLLAHQSGIPGTYYKNAETFVQQTNYYDMVLQLFAQDYPLDPPGFYEEYNNNGITLIEGVVQGGSGGTNFCDFTRTVLLQPMGLSNTVFTLDNAQHERLARYYKNGVLMPDEYVNAFASGGLYSSVNDLARWTKFLLNYGAYDGVTVLSSNSIDTIWTSQSDRVSLRQYDKAMNVGLGWDRVSDPVFAYAADRVCMKGGACEGYGSSIMVIPGQQLGVVVLNSIPGDSVVQPIARLTLQLALAEARGLIAPTNQLVLPVTPVCALTTNAIAAIAGSYATGGGGVDAGYEIIAGTTNGLVWIHNAQSATPTTITNLVLHEDGWFYDATGTPGGQFSFTNDGNRTFWKLRAFFQDRIETKIQGERFVPLPLESAWSNRAAKTWIVADLGPSDYRWVNGSDFRMNLRITNGVMMIYGFGGSVTLQPQSGNLAYPFAVGSSEVSALQARQTNGYEILHYAGYDFRAIEDLPVLQAGTSATGMLAAGEVALFQIDISTSVYHNIYVTPGNLDTHLRSLSGQSDTSDLSAITNAGLYFLTFQSASDTPYSVRLYTLTNTIARVSSLITNLMTSNNLVGCGFSIVDGAHTVLETGFGYADRENEIPADQNTIFMIGSCSKTFGAIAAMQLVERGLLDLDAPLTNALPSFSIHQRFAGNVITPRTILTHHSGMPGDIFNGGFTVRPNLAASGQVEAMLSDEYTLMPTNTSWAYNNSGLVMLGLAIEHLSGMSADAYASSNLFQRMGMTNSLLRRSADFDFQRIARPYGGGARCPEEYCNLEFAGSILSTATDMARYMKTILAGGMGENARVISNNTFNAMLVKQNSSIPLDQFNSVLNMGIGFVLDPPWLNYMGKICWHDGGTLYFRTLMRVATEAQLGCFISWNTAEAAVNGEIVDSALKWAYEEKTGIAPPVPCEPGAPSAAIAPPDTIALATGGVFVTDAGYDIFATNDTGLIAHLNAQAGSPSDTALVYRDNGWFTPTNSYATQYQFTQSVGRILCIIKNFSYGVTNTGVHGERSINISPYNAVWSNRLGRWWATDIYPSDVSWLYPGLLTFPMLDLSIKDNLLLLTTSASFVMSATNDDIAFSAGLGRNKGSALRVGVTNSAETLAFMGVHYQSAGSIPTLLPGAYTNGVIAGDGTSWYSIPAPTGATFTVDLATESDITAWIYDTNSAYIGQANRAHAYRFDATNARPLMVAVVRDGANTGSWRLIIHTNATPFYQALPFAQWPSTLAEKSNLFPNTDFGYVFVPENRTNQTGNILKIAVARMNSSDPSAQPLLFCNGGPGDSGIQCAYQYFLKTLTNDYDVYLIDQRGVDCSQPNVTYRTNETPADLQYRLAMLQGADLSVLNTLESSYDIEDLAAVFALTNANLHGVSYGTLLAQTLMRREPEWLRAVILDGVVAPNIPFLSQRGPMRNDALNALFADVAAHPRASAYYPNFPMTFYTLATNLQNHPVPIQYSGITNKTDGLAYLDADMLQMTVSDIGIRERIPNIAYRASAGETAALAELFTGIHADTNVFVPGVSSEVMQMLVFKHDVLPFDSMEAASNACADLPPLLRQLNLNFMQQVVDYASLFDPDGQADPSFTLPVTSAIPTLVINGTYDTQTGTNWAAEVARHLPNSHLVIVPTVGHGVLFGGPYPMQIVRDFLTDPSHAPDTSCLTNMYLDFPAPWPTNTSALAIGQPVTNAFANAGEAAWYRFTAVSGLYYNIGTDLGGSYARVVDAAGRDTGRNGAGVWNWLAPANGEYFAWLIAGTSGVARLDWTCPLMVRNIRSTAGSVVFDWQGVTNTAYDVWMSTNLTEHNSFVKIATNLPAAGWINSFTNRMDVPAAFLFPAQAEP
ncbi:MAG: alpha/beta fold hydrolase [bacterium]